MKRCLGLLLKKGTKASLACLGLAWLPMLFVYAVAPDSWGKLFLLVALWQLSLMWTALGTILGGLTAIRLRRKRWAIVALLANLTSLLVLLGIAAV